MALLYEIGAGTNVCRLGARNAENHRWKRGTKNEELNQHIGKGGNDLVAPYQYDDPGPYLLLDPGFFLVAIRICSSSNSLHGARARIILPT